MTSEKENKVREQALGQSKQRAQQVQRPRAGEVLSPKCFKEEIPWLVSSQLTLIIIWKPMPSTVSQSVQLLSHVWLFVTPWTAAHQASLSFTNSWSLLKLMAIELVMPFNHLILCHLLLLLPSICPSIRVFSNESVLRIRWPNYWSFSFCISPSSECSELISFRIDWFDILEVQGTFKSLLQHHSSKASILWCSAFFMVQLSHPYMTTEKTTALTRRTFVGKIMSLIFNMLSRYVIAFLPRSKRLLISCLHSPSAVILETQKIKSLTVSIVSPSICHEVMGLDATIFIFWMWSFKLAFSPSIVVISNISFLSGKLQVVLRKAYNEKESMGTSLVVQWWKLGFNQGTGSHVNWEFACSSWRFCICCCSVAQSCPTLWDPMDCSIPGFPVHHQLWSLLKLMSSELVMSSNHLVLFRPLLLVGSSDKMWSLGEGNGKPLQHSCLENPMSSMKRLCMPQRKDSTHHNEDRGSCVPQWDLAQPNTYIHIHKHMDK